MLRIVLYVWSCWMLAENYISHRMVWPMGNKDQAMLKPVSLLPNFTWVILSQARDPSTEISAATEPMIVCDKYSLPKNTCNYVHRFRMNSTKLVARITDHSCHLQKSPKSWCKWGWAPTSLLDCVILNENSADAWIVNEKWKMLEILSRWGSIWREKQRQCFRAIRHQNWVVTCWLWIHLSFEIKCYLQEISGFLLYFRRIKCSGQLPEQPASNVMSAWCALSHQGKQLF